MYTPLKTSDLALREEQNSRKLAELLLSTGRPHKDRSEPIQTFRFTEFSLQRYQITRLLDELTPKVTNSKQPEDIRRHRDNLRLLVYALTSAAFNLHWLAIPHQDKHYSQKNRARLGMLGLSRRRVDRILEVLIAEGLAIEGRKGFIDPRVGARAGYCSQYFPTERLLQYFAACLYEFDADFGVDIYLFNGFAEGTEPDPSAYREDEATLRAYNDFMRQFSWAKKGPIIRIFNRDMRRGGRLYTPYQNIVKHRIRIRPATLLDGEPIVEPDFSCNHLRMLAALHGEEIADDPYSDIGRACGASRDQVKRFLTVVLGARSKQQKGGIMLDLMRGEDRPIRKKLFNAIENEFYRAYPWIEENRLFFNDSGARMQFHEGNIAMRVCAEAVREGKPVIPVHDAFAVRRRDAVWVAEVMQSAWSKELGTTIRPRISIPGIPAGD